MTDDGTGDEERSPGCGGPGAPACATCREERLTCRMPPGTAWTNRRGFVKSVATAAAGTVASMLSARNIIRPVSATPTDDDDLFAATDARPPGAVFPQSVMSGGPTDSGVILWTRIDPGAVVSGEPLGVEVATDRSFGNVVHSTSVPPGEIDPAHDHAVKVDLDGHLDPDSVYYYRFTYDGVRSKVGRCRTLPAPGTTPDSLSFAVVTCQDYQNGYFPAYKHVAEEDVDFLLHMGDFIYESAEGHYIAPDDDIKPGRDLSLPSGMGLATTVEDFRYLYKRYKEDGFLSEALRKHTLIAGWDDHEVGNNRYWDYVTDSPRVPDHPDGDDPTRALEITANGIQAWVEHIPARVEYDPTETHLHEQMQLWRTVEFGDLVELVVTDERLYRDGPPCSPGTDVWECDGEDDPGRTMLGGEQKRWFESTVSNSSALWTVWMNEVLTMPLTAGSGDGEIELLHDSWDGFKHEREELFDTVANADPRNFVTITGDLHCSMAGYQKAEYDAVADPDRAARIGVELMTPAISSVNAADVLDFPGDWDRDLLAEIANQYNDHVEYYNWYRHGYSVVEFTPEDLYFTVHAVDKDTNDPDADHEVLVELRVPDGQASIQRRAAGDGDDGVLLGTGDASTGDDSSAGNASATGDDGSSAGDGSGPADVEGAGVAPPTDD